MKIFGLIGAVIVAGLVWTTSASAHKPFPPFANSILKADLATPAGMKAWSDAVGAAGQKTMIYADWHLLHFMKSELFNGLLPATAQARGESDACQAMQSGTSRKYALHARVDPGNNNLLAGLSFDLDRLPAFTLIDCEAVIGSGEEGLRIRGFFYVPDVRIEVAEEYSFVPLDVEPSQLPRDFFH
jgi:hypothetical protein